jgi:hypothetical protein
MIAAIAHTLPRAFRFARTRARARLEHVALGLGICLPVPLLAVTGLSIPLPSTVERIAASLVPWAESSALDESGAALGAGGSIIRSPEEGGVSGSAKKAESRAVGARASIGTARGSKPTAARPGAPAERTGTRPGVTPEDHSATAPADTTTPGEQRQEAGIVEDTTNTVRDTTRPIVDNVGNTVDNVTKPVIGVKPVETVKGVVPIGKK